VAEATSYRVHIPAAFTAMPMRPVTLETISTLWAKGLHRNPLHFPRLLDWVKDIQNCTALEVVCKQKVIKKDHQSGF